MNDFYTGLNLKEKAPQKLIAVAKKTKIINSEDDVLAILCTLIMPTSNNFAICTNKEIIYFESGFFYKSNKYPLTSITGITQENPSPTKNYAALIIGGSEKKVLDIIASKNGIMYFIDFVNNLMNQKSSNTSSFSSADEL